MFPALRAGYIIAPEGLAAAFAHAVRNTSQSVPQPVQGALADFIDAGHYGRHVRRMQSSTMRCRGNSGRGASGHGDSADDFGPGGNSRRSMKASR